METRLVRDIDTGEVHAVVYHKGKEARRWNVDVDYRKLMVDDHNALTVRLMKSPDPVAYEYAMAQHVFWRNHVAANKINSGDTMGVRGFLDKLNKCVEEGWEPCGDMVFAHVEDGQRAWQMLLRRPKDENS